MYFSNYMNFGEEEQEQGQVQEIKQVEETVQEGGNESFESYENNNLVTSEVRNRRYKTYGPNQYNYTKTEEYQMRKPNYKYMKNRRNPHNRSRQNLHRKMYNKTTQEQVTRPGAPGAANMGPMRPNRTYQTKYKTYTESENMNY